jgi:hypothetical protein
MATLLPMFRPLLLAALVLQGLPVFAQAKPVLDQGQRDQELFPGFTATRNQSPFPGFSATTNQSPYPGVVPAPINIVPLSAIPSVIGLEHRQPAQMSAADSEVVENLQAELSKQAALANFDISSPAWHYEQIVCPSFPGFVFLVFQHGPDEEGSSRFGAVLPRDNAEVRILSTYAHGILPFEASWNRPGSFEVFNGMLRRERGRKSLSKAEDWLMIALCYAELSGYPVQVLNTFPLAEPTMDLLRLEANQPQMLIGPNRSVDITFSDVSRPGITSNWDLHFDRNGQITSAGKRLFEQPSKIALKP